MGRMIDKYLRLQNDFPDCDVHASGRYRGFFNVLPGWKLSLQWPKRDARKLPLGGSNRWAQPMTRTRNRRTRTFEQPCHKPIGEAALFPQMHVTR